MADIRSRVIVTDAMSPALKSMNKALQLVLNSFQSLQDASSKPIDTAALDAARRELSNVDIVLNEIEEEQKRINKNAGQTKSLLSGIGGKVAQIAGAYVGVNAIKNAIEYASDLTEVQNVVDQTFKNSAGVINEWSKETLNAFGLNELTAKNFAGTMGAMLKSSGVTGNEVVDMSKSIVELAGDMASFYNLDADVAFQKIRSGISGETEPLKQLGINMSVANLEAFALSQGITKAYSSMSQAEQVTLRYQYLMAQTADAQGDFARTSDSFANQLKLLQENWTGLTGQIASYAIPLLTAGLQGLNGAIQLVANNLDIVLPIFAAVVAILGIYYGQLLLVKGAELAGLAVKGAMAIAEGIHAVAIMAATGATWAETTAQLGLNGALYACPLVWIIGLIIALIAIIYAVCAAIAKFTGVANSGLGVVVGAVYAVIAMFQNLWTFISTLASAIGKTFQAIGQNIRIAFSNSIKSVQATFYNLLSTAMSVIGQIADALSKLPFVEFDGAGLIGKANDYAGKAAELNASKEDYADVNFGQDISDAFANVEYKNLGEAFAKGAAKGDAWSASIADSFSQGDVGGMLGELTDTTGSIADNTGSTAGSAGKVADSVATTEEEIKYLKDIAEREAINRFTTAEIKVDMTNNNSISSGMDLDGIVSSLYNGIYEAMENMAEGSYA